MKNNKLKISVFSAILFSLFIFSNSALASEVTGNLSTGLNSTVGNTVNGVVIAPPVASPVTGTYTSAQNVGLTADGALNIHYTTDGTNPTCSSGTLYSSSISVSSSLTIKAISCYSESKSSNVAVYTYNINIPTAPVSSSGGGGGGGNSGGSRHTISTLPSQVNVGAVLGASAYNFTRNLSIGSSGNDVTELQNRLTTEGVYTGPITGYFGSLTLAGVKAYQAKYGINQTGFVGPLTLAKLNEGGAVLGAQTSSMTIDQMKTLLAQLQAQLATLMAKLNSLSQ